MMVVLIIPILNKPRCGKHPPHLAREALEGECLVRKMHSVCKTQGLGVMPQEHRKERNAR